MNRGSVYIMAAIAIVLVVYASLSARLVGPVVQGPLYPGLVDKVNAVAEIVIEQSDETITLKRDGEKWILPGKGGFAAAPVKIRKIILDTVALHLLEAKTKREDRYESLLVQDPKAKDARSRRMIFKDAKGAALVDLIVGKPKFDAGPAGGLYVRRWGEEQSWLVTGKLDPGRSLRDLVDRALVDIATKDVVSIRIAHADGETVTVVAGQGENASPHIEGLPKGAEEKKYVADDIISALSGVELDDVARAGSKTFAPDKTVNVEASTKDGMTVHLDLVEIDGNHWVRIDAAGTDAAKAIAEKTKDWVYRLPDYKAKSLRKRQADVIEPNKADKPKSGKR